MLFCYNCTHRWSVHYKELSLAEDLVRKLVKLRNKYGRSQEYVAFKMGIFPDTLRHIEKGRRPMPDFAHGRVEWIHAYLVAVGASEEEQEEVIKNIADLLAGEFTEWLRELGH